MSLPVDLPDAATAADSLPPAPAPRPRAPASLVVLATLAIGYTLWAAQTIILPIMLAAFFSLIGNPILRGLRKLYIPRFLGALLILCLGLAGTVTLAAQLAGPAAEWVQQAPRQMRQIARDVRDLTKPVMQANQAAENFARAAGGEGQRGVQIVRTQMDDPYKALVRTPKLAASVLAVVLLTFFFMVYGESLQRHAIALLPNRQQQRFTTEIMLDIEREVSRYVLTISVINTLVGLVFAGILSVLQIPLPEAILWGTVVALLNFAPYVGPLIGVMLMLLMGFVEFRTTLSSLLPAILYLALHTIEGQVVTPIVLGRRMAISPLMLILALMLFGWLWGMVGLLLAVPLLVCIKMVLSRVDGMQRWARLLE
ncbi:AI-2E family transporter [Xanthomonas phaseoli]|uniref:AI-2E family transporter n=1 Tax=Xanthomonas phaseoli TaxID=1985254 RepID=UPI001237F321|nr:AI-2E family transporter [Xanthomonas phaseoli]MBO9832615.1 AI-2E family transporter [Xanthomonas phaseoli pv. dieffenbachiae]MBO9838363.1 AI-2E family transporter [Xanthomonas phaseoli pv. dieffenbachiae]MBO9839472.1 AI-2E family transporter [Xanthomonas phaseoli pv. dieffenbachiae]MBO9861495.1 AI-2E family transporter [Xanthomonas phaseoli pv. dieffenbachiae]MBO9864306.1 AI-2E family transporter [Xanthomonas phaseoli pv. dieffenbachiae]